MDRPEITLGERRRLARRNVRVAVEELARVTADSQVKIAIVKEWLQATVDKAAALGVTGPDDLATLSQAKAEAPAEASAAFRAAKEAAALAALRASRPAFPAVHSSTRDVSGRVLEAAFAASCGLSAKSLEAAYNEQTLDASDRYRGIGLQETILQAASANGYSGRSRIGGGNVREVLERAFPRRLEAASTLSLPGILSNVANKLIADAFEAVEQTWREISSIVPVKDFKQVTHYRLTSDMIYELLPPSGEIKHGELGESSHTNQAHTYAKMFVLDRQTIINDDLGALSQLPRKLGRGAALKLNEVFWKAFLANTAFFSSGNVNLNTTSALTLATLGTATTKFMQLSDEDGHPLGISPQLLLCPPELAATAKSLYISTELRDTSVADAYYPVGNVWSGAYRPVVSAHLSNASMGGAYSASTWYLLAAPQNLATIEVVFLDGQQSPTVESTDADFSTLGIQSRGYWDFGCALSEWRAGVKSTA